MDVVLLSIDGREDVTDANRGGRGGVYRTVVNAFNYLRNTGLGGLLLG